jgi:hypothetical protein
LPDRDLYGDLEKIEARAKRKKQSGLSSRLRSVFGKGKEEEEEEEEPVEE